MMPLRAAMPSTVTKPTSEPSERTPPPRTAAEHAADQGERATSGTTRAVSRHVRKSAWMISRTPEQRQRGQGAAAAGVDSCAGRVLAEELGVVLAVERRARLHLLLDLAGDARPGRGP